LYYSNGEEFLEEISFREISKSETKVLEKFFDPYSEEYEDGEEDKAIVEEMLWHDENLELYGDDKTPADTDHAKSSKKIESIVNSLSKKELAIEVKKAKTFEQDWSVFYEIHKDDDSDILDIANYNSITDFCADLTEEEYNKHVHTDDCGSSVSYGFDIFSKVCDIILESEYECED
jgi:hypothetical protein